jgi:hypothetical protein
MNVDEIAAAVLAGAEQLFAKRVEPLLARIAELEAREYPKAEDVAAVAAQSLLAGDGIKSLVDLEVTAYMEANPPEKGEKGDPGEKGLDGADGIGMAGAMIDREGELILTNTKGDALRLGKIVGKDGADGLGFDDMQAETDGEGNVTLKLVRGGIVKEFPLSFAVPVYKGYWRQGTKAAKGNVLTHKGNSWIALTDTQDEPTRENKAVWQILAAKGSDGRDGRDGRDLGAPGSVKLNG